jgi:hypothetical protein
MQGKGVCVCRDYGGVIGCVAVSFVRAVTEHQSFWGTENGPPPQKKKGNWKITFSVEYANVISSLKNSFVSVPNAVTYG